MKHSVYDKDFTPLSDILRKTRVIDGSKFDMEGSLPLGIQTFILTPETALAVEKLSIDKKFAPPDLNEIKLPYKDVIVEMPLTNEVKSLRKPYIDNDQDINIVDTARIGARISCTTDVDGNNTFIFWPFWEHVGGMLGFGGVCLAFGSHVPDELPKVLIMNPYTNNETVAACFPSTPIIRGASKLPAAAQTTFIKDYWALLQKKTSIIRDVAEELYPLLFAWYTILNVKSGIARTNISAKTPSSKTGKLGKNKINQKSKSAYTIISLTENETVDISSGIVSITRDITAHYVRGHFKRRLGGLYWWNPHIRGKGEVMERSAYSM